MWKKYVGMIGLSLLTLSLVACGSPLETTGVDPNKDMDQLETGEQKKLADALTNEVYTKSNIETSCKIAAYFQAESAGASRCEETLKLCRAGAAAGAEVYSGALMQQYANCKDVTVKQWTSCMKVMKQYLEQLQPKMEKYSCQNPPNATLLLLDLDPELIRQYQLHCQNVLSKCNNAGGIGSGSTRTP